MVYNDSVAKIFSKARALDSPLAWPCVCLRHRIGTAVCTVSYPIVTLLQHPEEDTEAIVLNADCLIFDATLPPPMSLAYCLGLR